MKRIYKFITLVLFSGLMLNSCETTELNLRDNPNFLSGDQGNVDFFLNAIQLQYAELIDDLGYTGGRLVRMEVLQERNYLNALSPVNFDEEWEWAYQDILADIRKMQPLAEADGQYRHLGIANVIEADVIVTLVDYFGDVPYSEAIQGLANPNPKLDDAAGLYDAALALLDEAINNFTRDDNLLEVQNDFFYGGDYDNWVKLANTLKMKIYLQRRLVDPGAAAAFQAIVDTGDFISSTSEDFEFNWGINEVLPDTRHPSYISNYTPTGAGTYMSNWLMNYMQENGDPRIRYYFYRQVSVLPGEGGTDPDEETLRCSLQDAPLHYTDGGFTFCSLANGYWGRDHGDDEGIPPDGLLRTAYGIYPAGGAFDDDRFEGVEQGAGAGGAGITPLLLASTVDFMRAEMAMVAGNPGDAKQFILDGLDKSVAKVITFGPKDSSADLSFAPSMTEIADHTDLVDDAFEDATTDEERWNILAEQYWVAAFGNGTMNYNFYRRTGYPTTLQPNREPQPGGFIRSLRYPQNALNNASIQQKTNVTSQVFWDINPGSPGFPVAN
ncbi:SusD/RagB family nutrient-binding outer membrane lipoprotein [Ascidiimonas sp. W6]|uniref:SusD/RagB family nutrient-binding outer membrane lipoprotein n=1 Tax=Ascidiimonas meishanensis TaxID=3128903 RepID=UPI0030ED4571